MGWFRRETLNEKLMREAGLDHPHSPAQQAEPEPFEPEPKHPGLPSFGGRPLFESAGITGVARPRDWDVVVSAEVPDLLGNEVEFVTLPDGSLLVEREAGDAQLDPLATALEERIAPPYRAQGVRKTETLWAVSARRIEVARFVADGERIELTKTDEGKTLVVDGERVFGSVPELERLGEGAGATYAVRADRLDEDLWEVRVSSL